MKSKQYFAVTAFLTALFLCAIISTAQDVRPNFNRPRTYDVQNYVLRVSFDRDKKKVFGETMVQLKPLKSGMVEVELDAAALSFESVNLEPDSKPLKFRIAGAKVFVTLDRPYSTGDLISIRFKYTAEPKKGIYFIPAQVENGKPVRSAQIWTHGEPDEAHHWFPSFDFPSDKATTEQIITAQKGETVVGNGELIEKKENADGTVTWHYKMSVPHSTYLVSFVIGNYVNFPDKYNGIALGRYVYPGREAIVPQAYGKTKDILRAFEEVTKVAFPFNKYDQTIVSGFTFGGMENITATTMADNEIFLAGFDFAQSSIEDLVSHEMSHSWFGNLVTCNNWAELWLNEGFATFMEAVAREKLYGRESYMRKIIADAEIFMVDDAVSPKRIGLFNRNAANVATLFDRPATTYNKGGAVLHTLRETVGDEAFWKAINLYLNRYRLGNVETSDLQKTMEETSGQDLKWFFDQWVYGVGYPKLEVMQSYNARTKTLNITVNQIQKVDRFVPAAYRLPLELEITTSKGVVAEKLELTKRVEVFRYKVATKPLELKIDKNNKVPIKTVKIHQTPPRD